MGKTALSTASFCLWPITAERKVEICRELDFSRIEIAIPTLKMLKSYSLTEELVQLLGSFKEITIHAPWCGIKYGNNTKTRIALQHLHQLFSRLRAEALVFHFDCISDLQVLLSSGLPIYLENSEKPGTWPEYRDILHKTGLKCALNINRATRMDNYLPRILEEFGDRIAQVQVSGFGGYKGRMPLLSTGQHHLLDEVKAVRAPFVLEGLFSPEDYQAIALERQLVTETIGIK